MDIFSPASGFCLMFAYKNTGYKIFCDNSEQFFGHVTDYTVPYL